jgi:hypothetical protein
MLNFLLGLIVGGPIAWFVTHFVGKPFVRLYELRTRARTVLDMTANVSVSRKLENPEMKNAMERLRSLGIEIGALDETAWRPVRWWFRRLSYDLPQAKGALVGLSHALPSHDGSRAAFRYEAEKALKLAMSYSEKPTRREP